MTVITGLQLNSDGLETLATKLKQRCGTGGTVRDGVIEMQGDCRPRIAQELQKMGFKTKISGG